MSWKLSIEYPWWAVAICLLIAASYSALLYARQRESVFFKDNNWARVILPLLRFLLVSLLLLLLLGPFLNRLNYQTNKPILVVAVDQSLSMSQTEDSTAKIERLLASMNQKLSGKYDLKVQSLGDELSPMDSNHVFKAPSSNLSALFKVDGNYQFGRDIDAAVLISDGIFNKGVDPGNLAAQSKWPVYSLAWGDSSRQTDLAIEDVYYNSLVFKDNDYQIQIEVAADHLKGKSSQLQVSVNGEKQFESSLSFSSDEDFIEQSVVLPAQKLGLNKVEIQLASDPSEKYTTNNYYSFYVDVVEASKKVEIWTRTVHPDAGALLNAIKSNQQYAVEMIKDPAMFKPSNQDVIILHDWFSKSGDADLFNACKAKGIAVFVMLGPSFSTRWFNQAEWDVSFDMQSGWSSASAVLNSSFEYFDVADGLKTSLSKWAPLKVPFGKLQGAKPAEVFLYQQIGQVTTAEPLLLLKKERHYRYAILLGHGLWRWRMNNYQNMQNHELFNSLNSTIVQFLSLKDQKQAFKVYSSKRIYGESEKVRLLGELYNASLESMENAEIELALLKDGDLIEERIMGEKNQQYFLDLNALGHGSYEFIAKVEVAGELLTSKGSFVVSENQIELMDLRARYSLLQSIGAMSNGGFYAFNQADELVNHLAQSETHKASIEEERSWSSLIDFKALFILLLLFLSAEWLIRKLIGGY